MIRRVREAARFGLGVTTIAVGAVWLALWAVKVKL